ncbi:MAG: gamma-glutamylcyclotransferase [Gammaproteobacteria bacterium]|nr:gamma-glutamylcyclotransferase [Gammaproteobacteria bacterium]
MGKQVKLRYAAYGSNLHPHRLGRRVPSCDLLGTSFLPDHALHFHKQGMDGSGKCNIQAGGPGVYVAIYSIAATEKPLLDTFEHAGIGYAVSTIDVPGFGSCFTYVANDAHIVDNLDPYCWYREMVVLGCHRLGFPTAYISGITAVTPLRDPDHKRREAQWQLLAAMRETVRRPRKW